MSPIVIRKDEIADAQILAGFVRDLLSELSGGAAVDLQKIGSLCHLVLGSDRVTAALAFENDTPIGAMTLNECMAIYAGGMFGEISELYIVPDKRSQGVAQKFLKFAETLGRQANWSRLEVGAPTQPQWPRTRAFYLANRFDEVGPRLKRTIAV